MIGDVVQDVVDPHMCCRIDKRSCAALDLGVLPLAVLEELDLFHVRLPVNLGIYSRGSLAYASYSATLV